MKKIYGRGMTAGCYEILDVEKPCPSKRNIRYRLRCRECGCGKSVNQNTIRKYAQSGKCMCADRFVKISAGDVLGIYTVVETSHRGCRAFVSFRCNVCGNVRTRRRDIFLRDFSGHTECRCQKRYWKSEAVRMTPAESSEEAHRKYESFVGKTVGAWEILGMYERRRSDRGFVRFYWCRCTVCGKTTNIRADFVVSPSRRPIECRHRFSDFRVHSNPCRENRPCENVYVRDDSRMPSAPLGEYSRLFGSPLFMETVAQASIDGTLCELGNYFCLDGIVSGKNGKPSKRACHLAFVREHPDFETVWYNENGSKRIRGFRRWKHGKRGKKRVCDSSVL